MTQCELMTRIGEVQFVCIELNLYIDTHPDDTAALNDYYSYSRLLEELTAEYEERFGPLCGFGHSATEKGSWVNSEWPWEVR